MERKVVVTCIPPNSHDIGIEYWHYKSATGLQEIYYAKNLDGKWEKFTTNS